MRTGVFAHWDGNSGAQTNFTNAYIVPAQIESYENFVSPHSIPGHDIARNC